MDAAWFAEIGGAADISRRCAEGETRHATRHRYTRGPQENDVSPLSHILNHIRNLGCQRNNLLRGLRMGSLAVVSGGRRENAMEDIAEFLARWDDPRHPAHAKNSQYMHSRFGNINFTGEPGAHCSPDLTPAQDVFWEGIESGVRELVKALVVSRGLVTYTSCQGHDYRPAGLEPVERTVGVLPRSVREFHTSLGMMVEAGLESTGDGPVVPSVVQEILRDERGTALKVVDVIFERNTGAAWDDYFASLDDAMDRFIKAMGISVGQSATATGS